MTLEGVRRRRRQAATLAVLLTVNTVAVAFALTRERFDGAAVLALLGLASLVYALYLIERLR